MLKAFNLHKSYSDTQERVDVLKGIDLNIAFGETVAIIGPSGAGKSTLLHILGGLDSPDKGQVLLEGEDIYGLKESQLAELRNKDLGFVFQFYHLLPELTALENVMLPLMTKKGMSLKLKDIQLKAKDVLTQVGLESRLEHMPSQLSGGEQQRTAIARALMNEPRFLLCDEPTGNLDSKTGESIIQLLLDLNKAKDRTLVLVTHDQRLANLCSRQIHMKDGSLVEGV